MIQESISSYPGNCPCPYNSASNGSRCGKRSAWSRAGGYAALCYPDDISDAMMKKYRKAHGITGSGRSSRHDLRPALLTVRRGTVMRITRPFNEAVIYKRSETSSGAKTAWAGEGRRMHERVAQQHPNWEHIAIFGFGAVFLLVITVVAVVVPSPTQFQYDVFRTILAVSAAGVAVLIPGLLKIKYKNVISASGALAVFAIVYFFEPGEAVIREVTKLKAGPAIEKMIQDNPTIFGPAHVADG